MENENKGLMPEIPAPVPVQPAAAPVSAPIQAGSEESVPAPMGTPVSGSETQEKDSSDTRPEWYGKKKKKVTKDVVRLVLIIAAIALAVLLVIHRIGVRFCVTSELGEGRPDPSCYFVKETAAEYALGEEVSLNEEGFYVEVIHSSRWYHIVFLKVKDTIAPSGEDAHAEITSQQTITPYEAITNVSDASEWTAEWVDEPMFGSSGVIMTTVRLTDSYENSTDVPVTILAFEPKSMISWPLGSEDRPDAQDFLDVEGHKAAFVTDLETIDWNTMGTYPVTLSIDTYIYEREIQIVDGEPPVFVLKDLVIVKNEVVTPEDFLVECDDASDVTFTFVVDPDTSVIGITNIGVLATDAAGNSTEERAELSVVDVKLTVEASRTGLTENDMLKLLGYPVAEEPEVEETEDAGETETEAEESEEDEEIEEEEAVVEYVFTPDTLGNFYLTFKTPDGSKYLYLTVVDTTAPVAEIIVAEGFTGYELAPEAFIETMDDATEVTVSFLNAPDWNTEGEANGVIQLIDSVGNTQSYNVTANLVKDEVAPSIYGAIDRNCYVGEAVTYLKEVFAEDNADPNIEVEVDKSAVNSREVGDYPVTYTATDKAGNTTSVTVTYHFIEQTVTDEMIEEMVLDIFSQIFTEDMDLVDQARAIYDYVYDQIYYTGWADHSDWKGEAYRGYSEGVGDCFTYYSLTYVLLSHINCDVLSVERINGVEGHEVHFWCLVNLGSGWYHFDTINVAPENVKCFMWTQEECDQYSDHFWQYDTSLYPELETEPFDLK